MKNQKKVIKAIVIAVDVYPFKKLCPKESVLALNKDADILTYNKSTQNFEKIDNANKETVVNQIFLVNDDTDSESLKNIGINLEEAILLFHKDTSEDIQKLFSENMKVLSHHIENEVYAQVGKDLAQGGENVYENVYNHLLAALRTQLNNKTREGKNNSTVSPKTES